MYGEILKHLGFLTSGEVVFKTAGDMGGAVVGEAQQKVLSILQCLGILYSKAQAEEKGRKKRVQSSV